MIVDKDNELLTGIAGLPEGVFEHDGLITKRHLRASALALLRPLPGERLWDVGTGAGSIAIEWCRAAKGATAVGIEAKPERAARARRNAERLTVEGTFTVVEGPAEVMIPTLERPDAVFVGGGGTMRVLEMAMEAMGDHGRLVVHGITLEAEQLCAAAYERWGGELMRIQTEQAAPLGQLTGWTPARTLTQWAHLPNAGATVS